MSAHVFIAEDETSIVTLLKYNLEKEGHKVSYSENGEDALKQIKDKYPDLILMDWMLPDLSGVEICKNLKKDKKYNDIPVIMLTAKGEEEDKLRAFDTGADDYVTKPFDHAELDARCRAVLRRKSGSSQQILKFGNLTFSPLAGQLSIKGKIINLRNRELRLFELLLNARGQIFSKQKLVDRLFTYDEDVSDNAIEVYIGRLRKHLENTSLKISTHRGLGYRLDND